MAEISQEYKEQLGNRLRELRMMYGYTQRQLADYLDIDQSNYCKIEQGKRYLKKLSKYQKLCDLYGCTEEYILCKNDEYTPLDFHGDKFIDLEIIAQMNSTMNYLKMLRKVKKEKRMNR